MASDAEIEARFWKELQANPTIILGLDGVRDGHGQPMTAAFDDDHGPLWFFSADHVSLVTEVASGQGHRAIANYAAKGHGLFATIHGELSIDTDRAVIDRFWNPHIAAWYEKGKDDPSLRVLRLDTERAQIWLNETTLSAGIKRLMGTDPKKDYKGKVAEVTL